MLFVLARVFEHGARMRDDLEGAVSDVPIVVKLDDVLHARRMTLTELADRIGHHARQPVDPEDREGCAVRFSTLEAICDTLQCQPGDLLEYAKPVEEEAVQ